MSNRLYIDTVHVRYLRKEPAETRESFGFLIGDDYDQFEVLDLSSEAELPSTLEGVLRHCRNAEHTMVWDLFVQHVSADKGVHFDGHYVEAAELKQLLDAIADEEEE
jgi:hypothetical protein